MKSSRGHHLDVEQSYIAGAGFGTEYPQFDSEKPFGGDRSKTIRAANTFRQIRRILREINSCKRWPIGEVFSRAEYLAGIFFMHPAVTGVALTGSAARFETLCHDIDLVVLHSGGLPDISCVEPPDRYRKSLYEKKFKPLAEAIRDNTILSRVEIVRAGIPLNIVFVNEKILWDCGYLLSLEEKEKFSEFFLRVFNDIVLWLLLPNRRRGEFKDHTKDSVVTLQDVGAPAGVKYVLMQIRHNCSSPLCRPKETWEECRKKIKRRKLHWQHLFRGENFYL